MATAKDEIMRSAKLKNRSLLFALAASCAVSCLSACGVKGALSTPPPLWGETKSEADNPAESNPVLNESPISNNEDDDIFGDDYIEETEPF